MNRSLMENICRDPFRMFFPLGLVFAFWASGEWLFFAFVDSSRYPGQLHMDLMFGGFLLSFVVGFLMTAVPRFTSAGYAKPFEIVLALIPITVLTFAAVLQLRIYFLLSVIVSLLILLAFVLSRFFRRKSNPPYSFVFVGIGVLLGLIGFSLLALLESQIIQGPLLLQLGRNLSFQAMIFSLIIGVGTRLLPGILGWDDIVVQQKTVYENKPSFFRIIPLPAIIAAFLFVFSFPIETFFAITFGRWIRVFLVIWIAFTFWKLHLLPKKKNPHAIIIWLCAWMLIAGSLLYASSDGVWGIASLHLIFISGFCLMTLMVASRVILAHGTAGLSLEEKRLPYFLPGGLLILSALTRYSAAITPSSYINHLGYAAFCFVFGLAVWCYFFLPRMFIRT